MHKTGEILLTVMIAALPAIGAAADNKSKQIEIQSWSFGDGGGQGQRAESDAAERQRR